MSMYDITIVLVIDNNTGQRLALAETKTISDGLQSALEQIKDLNRKFNVGQRVRLIKSYPYNSYGEFDNRGELGTVVEYAIHHDGRDQTLWPIRVKFDNDTDPTSRGWLTRYDEIEAASSAAGPE